MAASFCFSNLFSFVLPPKPQPLPPPSYARFPIQNHNTLVVPQQNNDDQCYLNVMNPSLAGANMLFFRSAYNVQVVVDDNEPEERLLNRFRREVMKAGVIQECKRRRFFENKQEEKKRKTREAAKRKSRSRRPYSRFAGPNKQDVPTTKKELDDEDNWDMPEVDAPYV